VCGADGRRASWPGDAREPPPPNSAPTGPITHHVPASMSVREATRDGNVERSVRAPYAA